MSRGAPWAKAASRAASSLARATAAVERQHAIDRAAALDRLPAISGGPCNRCGTPTRQRTNSTTGRTFFGCTRYPHCVGTWKPPPVP